MPPAGNTSLLQPAITAVTGVLLPTTTQSAAAKALVLTDDSSLYQLKQAIVVSHFLADGTLAAAAPNH